MRTAAIAFGLLFAFFAGWLVATGSQRVDDLGTAVEVALREGDRLERTARLVPLLEQLDADNLSGVLSVYRRELSGLGECEIRLFVGAWTRFDGRAAFEETLGWMPSKLRVGVQAAAQGWALHDVAQARPIIEATAESRPRLAELLLQALVIGWVHSGESGLDAYLRTVAPSNDDLLTVAIGATRRAQGNASLLAWSERFGANLDPLLRAKVFRKAVRVVGRRDPQHAARFALSRWGQEYASEGPRVLVEAWIETDPQEAFEWLRTTAPLASREEAVGLAFGRWLYRDRRAALAWLEGAERTTFHDPAIRTLARQLAGSSPEDAHAWCHRTQSEAMRKQCAETVVRSAARGRARTP